MKTNRRVIKQTRQTAPSGKVAAKSPTLGNSNKAIRDGANASARTGKKAAVSKNDKRNFGGEVILEGKLSAAQKTEILNIVRNTGKNGPKDDEQVLSVTDKGGKLRLTTSGSELSVAIGKKVHTSHKGGKLTIVWGHAEAPVRVHWTKK